MCCKNMCCASRFCTGGKGAAGSRSQGFQANVQGPMKQNARNNLRFRDEGGSRGQEQHPGPEKQDSQHMLNQPRGSFSELCHNFGTRLSGVPLCLGTCLSNTHVAKT